MKRGDTIELTIESIAFGGAGVGHAETEKGRLAVFVDETVPGDKIRARIGGKKRNYALGYLDGFIQKAPTRIKPPCAHFGLREGELGAGNMCGDKVCGDRCGGCSLQYLSYENQLLIKQKNVFDAIERIGGLDGSKVLPILGCDSPIHYRNKMEFSFSRTKEGELGLGLHVRRRHHDLVELKECLLFSPYAGDLVVLLRDFFRKLDSEGALNGLELKSLFVREGKNTRETMINLVYENGTAGFLKDFRDLVCDFFANVEGTCLKSLFATEIINVKGRKKSVHERLLFGAPSINETLNVAGHELKFEIAPGSFFQPNTLQAQKLYEIALDFAGLCGGEIVYDLYCGTGTISLVCSINAGKVYGVEIAESSVLNARASAENNNISNVEFINADVAEAVSKIPETPDVVVLDPPRNGLLPPAIRQVCSISPPKIVYISCNPTTLARDLKIFKDAGYELIKIQPVDMFPNTYHIESVALIEKTSEIN